MPAAAGRVLRILPSTVDILTETQNLWQRFQHGDAFKRYLRDRLKLVVPALVLFVCFSVVVTAATVIYLGGTRSILVLVGLLMAPVVLVGSLFVQVFVFAQWLENRAIARATRRAPRTPKAELAATLAGLGAVVKGFPPAVLAIGAALILVPLLFLAALSGTVAVLMLAVVAAAPFAFALLDR